MTMSPRLCCCFMRSALERISGIVRLGESSMNSGALETGL